MNLCGTKQKLVVGTVLIIKTKHEHLKIVILLSH